MSRLAADIKLLQRAHEIASLTIWPQADNVSVPATTLQALMDQLDQESRRPTEYRLISTEAVWLMQAAKFVALHRADKNAAMIERWVRLAELLASGVALDLANARKSVEEVS